MEIQRTGKQAASAGLGAGNGLTAAGQVFGDGLQMGLWRLPLCKG